jgi:hypothetical protein
MEIIMMMRKAIASKDTTWRIYDKFATDAAALAAIVDVLAIISASWSGEKYSVETCSHRFD